MVFNRSEARSQSYRKLSDLELAIKRDLYGLL